MKIFIINGPNLNLLGTREKDIYGDISFTNYLQKLQKQFPELSIDYFQSNVEGELIDKLHEADAAYDGILLNAAGYTHTSVALGDAVAAVDIPVIEIHISNVYAREDFRHKSYISKNCEGLVIGFGLSSYDLGLQYFSNQNHQEV